MKNYIQTYVFFGLICLFFMGEVYSQEELNLTFKTPKTKFSTHAVSMIEYLHRVIASVQNETYWPIDNIDVHLIGKSKNNPQPVKVKRSFGGWGKKLELRFTQSAFRYAPGASFPKYSFDTILAILKNDVVFNQKQLKKIIQQQYKIQLSKPDDPKAIEFEQQDLLVLFEYLLYFDNVRVGETSLLKKSKLKTIYRVSDTVIYTEGMGAGGLYRNGTNEIVIARNSVSPQLVAHEFAHAIWFNHLTSKGRDLYTALSWSDGKICESNLFVSNYAAQDPAEDFAEHFEAFFNRPNQLLSIASVKYDFFKDIFGGLEVSFENAANLTVMLENGIYASKPPQISKYDFDVRPGVGAFSGNAVFSNELTVPFHEKTNQLSGFSASVKSLINSRFNLTSSHEFYDYFDNNAENSEQPGWLINWSEIIDRNETLKGRYEHRGITLKDRFENTARYIDEDFEKILPSGKDRFIDIEYGLPKPLVVDNITQIFPEMGRSASIKNAEVVLLNLKKNEYQIKIPLSIPREAFEASEKRLQIRYSIEDCKEPKSYGYADGRVTDYDGSHLTAVFNLWPRTDFCRLEKQKLKLNEIALIFPEYIRAKSQEQNQIYILQDLSFPISVKGDHYLYYFGMLNNNPPDINPIEVDLQNALFKINQTRNQDPECNCSYKMELLVPVKTSDLDRLTSIIIEVEGPNGRSLRFHARESHFHITSNGEYSMVSVIGSKVDLRSGLYNVREISLLNSESNSYQTLPTTRRVFKASVQPLDPPSHQHKN